MGETAKPQAPKTTGALSTRLFSSFADLPEVWSDLCGGGDLAMDPVVLSIVQRTLADQCRCWGVMVLDGETPVACAALCLFRTELMETANPGLASLRDHVRRVWPGFLRMKVLFCGLPVPSGSSHIRFRLGAPAEEVAAATAAIDDAMRRLARETAAKMLVFKELAEPSDVLADALRAAGYLQGEIPPMHHLDRRFPSFADYRDALRSRYRSQVQRSQKKLKSAGFETRCGRGRAFFDGYWSDAAHQLYVAVQQRAEHKLELMPSSFFRELAAELDEDVRLTVIVREDRVCAFTFAIARGDAHYNLYSGLDYALNEEGDLYFNLFYGDLDQAFRSGATSIHLGQTSDSFKSRLGSRAQPLYFFARGAAGWITAALRRAAPLAFPTIPRVRAQNVFAGDVGLDAD